MNNEPVKAEKAVLSIIRLADGAVGPRVFAVLRVNEAACWCCSGACGSEEWGRLPPL